MHGHVQNWISIMKAALCRYVVTASRANSSISSPNRKSAAGKYIGEKKKKKLVKYCAALMCVCLSFSPKQVDLLKLF